MTKAKFKRLFISANTKEREQIKSCWEDIYKGAIFAESLQEAETVLLWIREAENEL